MSELVERPWGFYKVLGGGEGYQIKELRVNPGMRLSYQRHSYRSEHWYILSGEAEVTIDGQESRLGMGESIDVKVEQAHRVGAIGLEQLVIIEVQRGSYLGEDDIVRLEDDYGRVG